MSSKDISHLDLPETTIEHSQIIKNKPSLREIYIQYYKQFKRLLPINIRGKVIELGSGGGFIKEIIPEAITSDVMPLPMCDLEFSVEKIPFPNKSISAFLMLNTFHHFKNPEKALKEMSRCLKPGGRIIMIEPYNNFWSRLIYQNTHHEVFDPKAGWAIKSKGPLSGANGAMAWIVFLRDAKKFKDKHPELDIIRNQPHTPLSYLLSGGLSKPQLIPTFLFPTIKGIEESLKPIMKFVGMFTTIVIIKR